MEIGNAGNALRAMVSSSNVQNNPCMQSLQLHKSVCARTRARLCVRVQ